MSWTNPRTWILGELVTETLLNTHLRDNLNFLKSNPAIGGFTVNTQVISGINGVATAITLGSVSIPSDVGAVYCDAWANQLNTASHQSFSSNNAVATIVDSVVGQIASGSVYSNTNANAVGAPLFIRSADYAWGGTTRTISLQVTGVNCEGQLQAPMTLRIMRAF